MSRHKPDAIQKEEERRRDAVLKMMKAVLVYTDQEDRKPVEKRKLPESKRILDLLFDKTHGCRTTKWGIAPKSEMHVRCEALYLRVVHEDFRKTIDKTRHAREPGAIKAAGKDGKELAQHESGEKLATLMRFDTDVRNKKLGRAFGVDAALRNEARDLLRVVYTDQSKNARALLKLLWPVLPSVVYAMLIGMLQTALRSVFHQIGIVRATCRLNACPVRGLSKHVSLRSAKHRSPSDALWCTCALALAVGADD